MPKLSTNIETTKIKKIKKSLEKIQKYEFKYECTIKVIDKALCIKYPQMCWHAVKINLIIYFIR